MNSKVIVPSAGESISEGEVGQWFKKNNEEIEKDEIIAELETEKASLEIRSPESGVLKILVEEGSTVNIGDTIAEIEESSGTSSKKESVDDRVSETTLKSNLNNSSTPLHASPSVRKTIREKEIPVESITPSGKGGRITSEDLSKKITSSASLTPPSLKSFSVERNVTRKRMSKVRRTIASRLLYTKKNTALLTTFNEVDMSEVIKIRNKYKDSFKEQFQVGLGFNSFFMKAASLALKAYPVVNSAIDGDDLVTHDYCDIGIAVATPKGLVVPIVRDTDKKGFREIESNILEFALKGKENKIELEGMTGGTFTITNGGTFGSMLSTPIINYPQSAILGLHNIVERPVAVKGQVEIRPIMYVALSYDHRNIDGADAVQFLVHVKKSIEDPSKMLLGI